MTAGSGTATVHGRPKDRLARVYLLTVLVRPATKEIRAVEAAEIAGRRAYFYPTGFPKPDIVLLGYTTSEPSPRASGIVNAEILSPLFCGTRLRSDSLRALPVRGLPQRSPLIPLS